MTALAFVPTATHPLLSDAAYHPYLRWLQGGAWLAVSRPAQFLCTARGDAAVGSGQSGKNERLWVYAAAGPSREQGRRCRASVALRLDVRGLECAACVWLWKSCSLKKARCRPHHGQSCRRSDRAFVSPHRSTVAKPSSSLSMMSKRSAIGWPARKDGDAKVDDLVLRFGLSAALSMNSMIFAFSTYFGLSQREEPIIYKLFGTPAVWHWAQRRC